ncbi:MAG: flagellar export protein FliJ [Spirochaetales bacterium]|nr:flagellar export protein FliJ [Spirochaetales bacterium]
MKRFQFNLQRILSLREYKEKEWEIKLGEITGRCVHLQSAVADRIRNREEVLKLRHREGPEDLQYAEYMEDYFQRMMVEQKYLEQELLEAERKRVEIQESFLGASRDRKVLDNLKEKRQKEYYKAQAAAEFKHLDEMNSGAAVRKMAYRTAEGGEA